MGRRRHHLRRLEQILRRDMESFELEDGSLFYYEKGSASLFSYIFECMRSQALGEPLPEPHPVVQALTKAKDRGAAFDQALGTSPSMLADEFPYDKDALMLDGELIRIDCEPVPRGYE